MLQLNFLNSLYVMQNESSIDIQFKMLDIFPNVKKSAQDAYLKQLPKSAEEKDNDVFDVIGAKNQADLTSVGQNTLKVKKVPTHALAPGVLVFPLIRKSLSKKT